MSNWFNVLYTYRVKFESLEDCNETIKVSNNLSRYKGPAAEEDGRVDILKDYLMDFRGLQEHSFNYLKKCIDYAKLLKQEDVDKIYELLNKYSPEDAGVQTCIHNLSCLYAGGSVFLDNERRKTVQPKEFIKEEHAVNLSRDFEVLKTGKHTLQNLINFYYKILTYDKKFYRINYQDVSDEEQKYRLLNVPYVLCKIMETVTDREFFQNNSLLRLYTSILRTSDKTNKITDVDFAKDVTVYNIGGVVNKDDKHLIEVDGIDDISAQITEIDKLLKDTDIYKCVSTHLNVNMDTNRKAFDESVRDSVKNLRDVLVNVKYEKVKTLSEVLDKITQYMSNDNEDENSQLNAQNIKECIQYVNEILSFDFNVYVKDVKDALSLANAINNVKNQKLEISDLDSKIKLIYNFEDCVNQWKSFIESVLYEKYNKNFTETFNNIISDIIETTKDDNGELIFEKCFNKDKLTNDFMSILKQIKIDDLEQTYKTFVEIDVFNKDFKYNSSTFTKLNGVKLFIDLLLKLFSLKFTTFVTLDTTKHIENGWYHLACNFVYRKDYNVINNSKKQQQNDEQSQDDKQTQNQQNNQQHVSDSFIMYHGHNIILEESETDKKSYFDKLADTLDKFINNPKVQTELNSKEPEELLQAYVGDKVKIKGVKCGNYYDDITTADNSEFDTSKINTFDSSVGVSPEEFALASAADSTKKAADKFTGDGAEIQTESYFI